MFEQKLQRQSNNYFKLVAEIAYQIVGIACLEIIDDSAELDELVVHMKFRSQNVGTQLVNNLERIAVNHQCKEVTVRFAARNVSALKFYHTNGFNCFGMIELFKPLTEYTQLHWGKTGKSIHIANRKFLY